MKKVIVPVSGGKDSQVVLDLAIKAGKAPVCVHQNTGYDHPFTYAQLKDMEAFYNIVIHHTVSKYGDMFGFLEHAKYFPNTSARGCTQRLKQEPFARWLVENGFNSHNCEIWFGMRSDESAVRASKYGGLTNDDVFTLGDISHFYSTGKHKSLGDILCRLPIVEYSTNDVFSYLKNTKAPINKLYALGHHRVGCYPCLLARKAEWEAAARDEVGRKHLERLLKLQSEWEANCNPRKFIKVHRKWDIRKLLETGKIEGYNCEQECGYCSI